MKTNKNILIAFILNLIFSIFEFVGGVFTKSVAITSDAVHDLGDALSIGLAYFLEKISQKQPDEKYTYGYLRYSVLGGVVTTVILLVGSIGVIVNAVYKIINPTQINYNSMIIFAVVGVIVNFIAALFTRDGDSINQKAVNLHMLEDVLGWIVVLVGAVVMRFTDFYIIDPIMSIGVAVFILINAVKNLISVLDLFLEKTPNNIDVEEITKHVLAVEGVEGVHHVHLRSIDGQNVYATMHVVTEHEGADIKKKIKHELLHLGVSHATLELEKRDEICGEECCHISHSHSHGHHHHHH